MRLYASRTIAGSPRSTIAARLLAIVTALVLAITVGALGASTAEAKTKHMETGANFWYQVQSGVAQRDAYCSASSDESLKQLTETGATTVALIATLAQDTQTSSSIHRRYNSPTDTCMIHAIQQAHKLGLRVAIKMGLKLNTKVEGQSDWSMKFQPDDPDAWQASWDSWLNHYGLMAQRYGVETFVIGTEQAGQLNTNASAAFKKRLLKKMDKNNPKRWIASVKKVRAIYTGEVTYAAHDSDDAKYLDKTFVSSLDYLGLTTYPGTSGKHSTKNLKKVLKPLSKSLFDKLGKKYHTKIMVFEYGITSSSKGKVDLTLQSHFYDAYLSVMYANKYVIGVIAWGWYTDPNEGGSSSQTLTPQNKPAEDVMTKWYGGKSVIVWWPKDHTKVKASQTASSVKAKQSDERSLKKYAMTYQVDGGKRVKMASSTVGGRHKQATIDPSKLSKGTHLIVIRSTDTKGKPNGVAVREFTVV